MKKIIGLGLLCVVTLISACTEHELSTTTVEEYNITSEIAGLTTNEQIVGTKFKTHVARINLEDTFGAHGCAVVNHAKNECYLSVLYNAQGMNYWVGVELEHDNKQAIVSFFYPASDTRSSNELAMTFIFVGRLAHNDSGMSCTTHKSKEMLLQDISHGGEFENFRSATNFTQWIDAISKELPMLGSEMLCTQKKMEI